MKKAISLLLLVVMLFSLVACGGNSDAAVPAPTGVSEALKATYPELCTKSVKELLEDPNYGLEMLQQVVVQTALAYYYQNPNTQYESGSNAILFGSRAGGNTRTLQMAPEQIGSDTRYFNQCSGYVYDVYYNAFNTKADGTGESFETYGGPGFWAEAGASGAGYLTKIDDPATRIFVYNASTAKAGELEPALEEFRKLIQPGDIIETPGHIMIYLGDCFGDGKEYVGHCWAYNGGCNVDETGVQMFEPEGAIVVQTLDVLCYGARNPKKLPTFQLGYDRGGESFAIIRPLMHEKMAEHYVTYAAATRFSHSYMGVYKSADKNVFEAVLPNSDVTVTETIVNHSGIDKVRAEDYTGITLTESIPAGTKFISCSEGGTEKNGVITWNLNVPAGEKATVTYTFNVGKKDIGEDIVVPSGYLDTLPTRTFALKVGYGSMSEANQAKLKATAKAHLSDSYKDLDFVNDFYREAFGVELNLPKTMTELEDLLTNVEKIKGSKYYIVKEKTAENAAIWNMATPRHFIGKRVIYELDNLLHDNLIRQHELRKEFCEPGDVYITTGGTYDYPENIEIDIILEDYSVLKYTDSGISIELFPDTIAILPRQSFILALRPSRTFESLSK